MRRGKSGATRQNETLKRIVSAIRPHAPAAGAGRRVGAEVVGTVVFGHPQGGICWSVTPPPALRPVAAQLRRQVSAPASATSINGSASFECRTINLQSAVIAIIIGKVTGILLLT